MASFFGSGILGSSVESSEITDDTIVNADVNTAAAIEITKLDFHGATAKTTLTGADELVIWDSAASANKRITYTNALATLDDTFLTRANDLSDLASASTARTNLGLTAVATQTLTQYSPLVGGATNAITSLGPLTNGQLVIGSTGVAPVAATLTSSDSSLTFSGGAGTLSGVIGTAAITGKTEDTAPDLAADFALTYDDSATTFKKVLLQNFTKWYMGSFTRDLTTASGNQSVTGVGFKPRFLIDMSTGIDGTGATYYSFDGHSNVSTNACSTVVVGATAFGQGTIAAAVGTSGVAYQTLVVASMDSDGFTVTWTKTSTPTGTGRVGFVAVG